MASAQFYDKAKVDTLLTAKANAYMDGASSVIPESATLEFENLEETFTMAKVGDTWKALLYIIDDVPCFFVINGFTAGCDSVSLVSECQGETTTLGTLNRVGSTNTYVGNAGTGCTFTYTPETPAVPGTADPTKANMGVKDANGNVITATYATNSAMNAKRDKTDIAAYDETYSPWTITTPYSSTVALTSVSASRIVWTCNDYEGVYISQEGGPTGTTWNFKNGAESETVLATCTAPADTLTLSFTIATGYALTFTRTSVKTPTASGSLVKSFAAVGGVTPTVSSGVANLASLFSSENTSLMGVLPYKYDAPSAPTETAILFSETSTYAVGDIATYSGAVYHCIVAVETAGAWTGSTNWTQITTTYDASSGTYAVGDYVIYNSAYYVCKTAISTAESFDADKWTAIPVNAITVTLADATITRVTLGTNVGRVNLLLAAPESGKVYESIVRFDTGSCVPSFTYGITGKSVNALEMSGDDVEASAKFEKLLTAYAATAANTYDVTIGTKKLGE